MACFALGRQPSVTSGRFRLTLPDEFVCHRPRCVPARVVPRRAPGKPSPDLVMRLEGLDFEASAAVCGGVLASKSEDIRARRDDRLSTIPITTGASPRRSAVRWALSIQARHGRARLAEDSLLIPALAMIRAVRQRYAVGYDDEPIAETQRLLGAVGNDDYSAIQQRKHAWRRGLIPVLHPWNSLSERQLSMPVDGRALHTWIADAPGRGSVAPACDGLSPWSIPQSEMKGAFTALWQAGIVFDPRRHAENAEQRDRRLDS